ncbi:MAG: hydrolase [Actinobacteria bacterium HGW-Actinobacteria-10]|jgi:nicotinamidase-related amidase|nr:MAG: hydrolase [Actinobacteria bacterium HGW-Actinobacteria-10]
MPTFHETHADRLNAVLVVIDVQARLAGVMAERDAVIQATTRLVRTFGLVGAPLVVTRQYPAGLGETVPEVEEALLELARDGTRVSGVDKMAFCAACDHDFSDALSGTGRRQVVLAGMETHICITQTALTLLVQGYQVQVVADACCSRNANDHAVALDRLRAAGVVVTTSESVMYELVGTAGTDEFKSLLRIVKG